MEFSSSSSFKIIVILMIIIPRHSASIAFNFHNIYDQQAAEITLGNNNSYVSPLGLQLTSNEFETDRTGRGGRATYVRPLHLWDNISSEAADFSTNFTFVIDSTGNYPCGDGLAFFLAANNSDIGSGSALGLPMDLISLNATAPFVSLEFDTFANRRWDPFNSTNTSTGHHVGINVNSLSSVQSMRWFGNISAGSENQAWIDYDAATHNLTVRFTEYRNNQMEIVTGLYHIVDLRQVLPEWVIFGVSAATGTYYQRNTVRSWGFTSSTLRVDEEQRIRPNVGLVAGASAGLAVFIILLVLLGFKIAVKRVSSTSKQGIKEYASEVSIISRLRHRNLVQLIGWCHEHGQLLLVYEFMENGSLDSHLFNNKSLLTWRTRFKIAQGIASALLYLYGAGKILEAADLKLNDVDNEEEIQRLMVVGLWCAHPDWKLRPSIKQAIQLLNDESPSPKLPSKMPVATYSSPSPSICSEDSRVNSLTYTFSQSEIQPRT